MRQKAAAGLSLESNFVVGCTSEHSPTKHKSIRYAFSEGPVASLVGFNIFDI